MPYILDGLFQDESEPEMVAKSYSAGRDNGRQEASPAHLWHLQGGWNTAGRVDHCREGGPLQGGLTTAGRVDQFREGGPLQGG